MPFVGVAVDPAPAASVVDPFGSSEPCGRLGVSQQCKPARMSLGRLDLISALSHMQRPDPNAKNRNRERRTNRTCWTRPRLRSPRREGKRALAATTWHGLHHFEI